MIEKFAIFGGLGFVFVSVGFLLKGATIHPSSFAIGTIVSLITQILVMRRYVSFIRKGKGSKCWTWNTILNQYISVAIAIAAFAGLFAAAGSTGLERIPFPVCIVSYFKLVFCKLSHSWLTNNHFIVFLVFVSFYLQLNNKQHTEFDINKSRSCCCQYPGWTSFV